MIDAILFWLAKEFSQFLFVFGIVALFALFFVAVIVYDKVTRWWQK
jgi:hypothetical protein